MPSTRHSKNQTNRSFYSYKERRKDAAQSGFGTIHERVSKDSVKDFDCCSLTFQPCREPVVSPQGYIFEKEAILEYILAQKRDNARMLKLWEKQKAKDEKEMQDLAKAEIEQKTRKFLALEGTPVHPGGSFDGDRTPGRTPGLFSPGGIFSPGPSAADPTSFAQNSDLCFKKKNLSFWVPELQSQAAKSKIMEKPSQKVFCPLSKQQLKARELIPIEFTPIVNDEKSNSMAGRSVAGRYMCPVTHDILTNSTPCAVLKTSGKVVTLECVEKIIKKDESWVDPTNGKKLTEADILPLQRGGTGFAATNELKFKLDRPEAQTA